MSENDGPVLTVGQLREAFDGYSDDTQVWSVYEGFGYGPISQVLGESDKDWIKEYTQIPEDAMTLVLHS